MAALNKSKWFTDPSKKQLIIITLVWAICVSTIVLDKTDFFTTSFWNTDYFITYSVLLYSVYLLRTIYTNYFRARKN